MSMTLKLMVNPFGDRKNPIQAGEVYVASDGDEHYYRVSARKDGRLSVIAKGSISKLKMDGTRRSGHRNFIQLLKDVIADIDLEQLGENYVDISKEVLEIYPDAKLGSYPDYDKS